MSWPTRVSNDRLLDEQQEAYIYTITQQWDVFWKPNVATPSDLPLTWNSLNDHRIVDSDGFVRKWDWSAWIIPSAWWSWIPSQDIARTLQNTVICNPDLDPASEEVWVAYINLQDAVDYCHAQWVATGNKWFVEMWWGSHGDVEMKEWVGLVWLGIDSTFVETLTTNVIFTGVNFVNTTLENISITSLDIGAWQVLAFKDSAIYWWVVDNGIFAWLAGNVAMEIYGVDFSTAAFFFADGVYTRECIMPVDVELFGGRHIDNEYNWATFINSSMETDILGNTINLGDYSFIGALWLIELDPFNVLPSGSSINWANTFFQWDWEMQAGTLANILDWCSWWLLIPQDPSCVIQLRNTAIDVDNNIWCNINVRQWNIDTSWFSVLSNPPEQAKDLQPIIEEIDTILATVWANTVFVDPSQPSNDPTLRLYNNFDDAYNALWISSSTVSNIYIAWSVATPDTWASYDLRNVNIRAWSAWTGSYKSSITFSGTDTIIFRPLSIEWMTVDFQNPWNTCSMWWWEQVVAYHKNCQFTLNGNFAVFATLDNTSATIYNEWCHFSGTGTMFRSQYNISIWLFTIHTTNCDFSDAWNGLFINNTSRSKNFVWIDEWNNLYNDWLVAWLYEHSMSEISHWSGLFASNWSSTETVANLTVIADIDNRDVIQIQTASPHWLSIWDKIEITGITPADYNWYYEISSIPAADQIEIVVDWQWTNPWAYVSWGTINVLTAQKIMKTAGFLWPADVISFEAFIELASNVNDKRFKIVAFNDSAWIRTSVDIMDENYNTVITETDWLIKWVLEYGAWSFVCRSYSIVDNTITQNTSTNVSIPLWWNFEMWLVLDAPVAELNVHTFALSHQKRKWLS